MTTAIAVAVLMPELALADYGGSDFQNRMSGLTSNLVNVLMPAVAILGLVYASILAAMGDESSKSRMILCIVASCVAFLAPIFIHWLQSFMGG
jgi:type IV secretory pathway VirB2 component (pilin)